MVGQPLPAILHEWRIGRPEAGGWRLEAGNSRPRLWRIGLQADGSYGPSGAFAGCRMFLRRLNHLLSPAKRRPGSPCCYQRLTHSNAYSQQRLLRSEIAVARRTLVCRTPVVTVAAMRKYRERVVVKRMPRSFLCMADIVRAT